MALCRSAFLVSADADEMIVGRMRDPETWKGLDSVNSSSPFPPDRWVLPAGHLRLGEHPEATASETIGICASSSI